MDEAVQRYIDAISAEQKPLFDRLQTLILELYPDAEIVISYQIPTYKARGGQLSLGLWKSGVSLYTTDPQHIEKFKSRHPTIKTGKPASTSSSPTNSPRRTFGRSSDRRSSELHVRVRPTDGGSPSGQRHRRAHAQGFIVATSLRLRD
ncbi:MAG: hypothetical protein ACRDOS_07895 [Gaiellaceae bacterium]|jgi:hypothetical protein